MNEAKKLIGDAARAQEPFGDETLEEHVEGLRKEVSELIRKRREEGGLHRLNDFILNLRFGKGWNYRATAELFRTGAGLDEADFDQLMAELDEL